MRDITLEKILQKHFGCKKPFLAKKRPIGKYHDGTVTYSYLSNKGSEAYGKLTELLYDLEELGVLQGVNDTVEMLDQITEGDY